MTRLIHDLVLKGQQVLVAGKKSPYLVERAIQSSAFKGRVQGTSTPIMIKTEDHPILYERELDVYEFDCVRKSPYIRSMYEAVDNGTDKCMVFEWMEHDLWSLRHQKRPPNSVFPKTIAKSLADLGNLIPAGEQFENRLQGLAIRAPEIWMGRPISTACDVWSVGVSLAHFLAAKPLFGPLGVEIRIGSKSDETVQAACSIVKIIQLIGLFPWDEGSKYTEEFDLAKLLVKKGLIKDKSLEVELTSMGVPKDCVEFIRYLLTLNANERPTAAQALEHPWLQSVA